jgi:hypothetical protein
MSLSTITADTLLRSLALSIARNAVGAMRPLSEVLAAEGMVQSEYDLIAQNSQFKRYVDAYTADLKENGYSFAAKSKVLAEDLLPTAYHMARDPETPAAVRAKILENLVEWADLKPKKAQENNSGPGYGISIVINGVATTSQATSMVIDATTASQQPSITLDLPSAAEKLPSPIVLDEPETYEYAGEDIYL